MKIRKSINSARGYFDDRTNAENNKKILQTLANSLYDEYADSSIIAIDDTLRSTVTDGAYKLNIYIDPPNYKDEKHIQIISTADGRGKFICRVYDSDMNLIEEDTISMSGCKQAVINKIDDLISNIDLKSNGVESSMKIRRNRVTANKRRAVRATIESNPDISIIQNQFPAFLGEIQDEFESMTDDVYEYWDTKDADDPIDNYYEPFRVEGTKFISERTLVDFELNLWYGRTEVGTVLITYNAEEEVPFTVTVSDSDTVQAEGNSFDDIYDICLSELERLAEDYVNFS